MPIQKKNTIRAYDSTLTKFSEMFGSAEMDEVSTDDALSFLNNLAQKRKQGTKRTRFSHLSSFFNFIKNNVDHSLHNPCDTPMMKNCSGERCIHTGTLLKKIWLTRLFLEPLKKETDLFWNSWPVAGCELVKF